MKLATILFGCFLVFLGCTSDDMLELEQSESSSQIGAGSSQATNQYSSGDIFPENPIIQNFPEGENGSEGDEIDIGRQGNQTPTTTSPTPVTPTTNPPVSHPPTNNPPVTSPPATNPQPNIISCDLTPQPLQPFASSYPDTCQGYTAELGIMNTNLVLAAGGGSGSNKLCCQTDSDCIRHTVLVPSLYGGGCPANMNQDWADAYENQKGIYQNLSLIHI